MHTRCPHCSTVFRIRNRELEMAGGWVRCGYCTRAFDARHHLQATLELEDGHPQEELGLETVADVGRQQEEDPLLQELAEAAAQPGRSGSGVARLLGWSAVNVLFLGVLLVQLVVLQRDVFAQDPLFRPMIVHACSVAGCEVPARRATDRFELVRRSVYSHPNREDALIIEGEFVNTADFVQPYPLLAVSMGDLHGQIHVRRVFSPGEYLADEETQDGMTPGGAARIMLAVHDPGARARTFELDFY